MINGTHYEESRDIAKYSYRAFMVVCWWGPRFGDGRIEYPQCERICDWFRENLGNDPFTLNGVYQDGSMHISSWASAETAMKIWRKWTPEKDFTHYEARDPRRP